MKIEVNDGNFYYGKRKKKTEPSFLYRNSINLKLCEGEILSVLGPNGAGKTTFLKCLMGLKDWKQGETRIEGKSIKDYSSRELWKLVGYVPQASKMAFAYSVLEMVTMGRAMYIRSYSQPSAKDEAAAMEALESIGIAHLAYQSCNSISGGELQLALIARTLVADPKLLILDEPESHLDIQKQKIILQTIKKLVKEQNITCIINTHYPNHAFYFGDQVMMVSKQQPVIVGKTEEIMTEENMEKYFNIRVKKVETEVEDRTFKSMIPHYLSEATQDSQFNL